MRYLEIYDYNQAYYYIQQGVLPIRICYNSNTNSSYFLFTKEDTNSLYTNWLNRTATIKDVTKQQVG